MLSRSRNNHDDKLRHFYRIFSFLAVLTRTYAVSYFVASVNDESKIVRRLLFSVSTRSYCREVG